VVPRCSSAFASRSGGAAAALLAIALGGCSDEIEGEWAYRDAPDDLLLEARFVASPDNPGEGDVLFDIAHVPTVKMAVSWWGLDDGRYRIDFRCLEVPDSDLGCESLSFWLACTLEGDRLACDFADCAECGSFGFERVP
jgi:hypothetical protein